MAINKLLISLSKRVALFHLKVTTKRLAQSHCETISKILFLIILNNFTLTKVKISMPRNQSFLFCYIGILNFDKCL